MAYCSTQYRCWNTKAVHHTVTDAMPELLTPAVEMYKRYAPQRMGKCCTRAVTLSGMCGKRVNVSAA